MGKINLVLSGGGARGIAHLGAIKALQECDLIINAISGVSSGAIVGAFIAKGMTPDEVLEIAVKNSGFSITRPPFSLGLFNKKNMLQVLTRYFGKLNFSDLKIPLHVSATNINSCNTDYFNTGDLLMPVIASAAIPVFFAPVSINGFRYLDGAFVNNLPVEPFLDDPLPLIGINVNHLDESVELTSTLKILERTIQIAVNKNTQQRKHHCHLFIEPPQLSAYTCFELDKSRAIFEIGYKHAKNVIEAFLKDGKEHQLSTSPRHAA